MAPRGMEAVIRSAASAASPTAWELHQGAPSPVICMPSCRPGHGLDADEGRAFPCKSQVLDELGEPIRGIREAILPLSSFCMPLLCSYYAFTSPSYIEM